jgi:F-type H+-transporting ATPase subunit epsilon
VITVLADTAIRGADLDEAKANEALRSRGSAAQRQGQAGDRDRGERAVDARRQLAAIRKLRKK